MFGETWFSKIIFKRGPAKVSSIGGGHHSTGIAEHEPCTPPQHGWGIMCAGFALLAFLVMGCGVVRPQKGGSAKTGQHTELRQGENPAAPSAQTTEEITEEKWIVPSSKLQVPSSKETPNMAGGQVRKWESGNGTNRTNGKYGTNGAPQVYGPFVPEIDWAHATVLQRRVERRSGTTLGAAQKDTARETSAKIAGMRPMQWVGVVLLLAALAMFYPPVAAITLSKTLQGATALVGGALIFAPLIIVGHEVLIIGVSVGGLAVWWLAHRHGHLRGELTAENAENAERVPTDDADDADGETTERTQGTQIANSQSGPAVQAIANGGNATEGNEGNKG